MYYIACFGDSLIQGFPYHNDYSWIKQVENQQISMLNYGICGDCCEDILYRLKQYPLPDYVQNIIFLGGANDILQGKKLTAILDEYQKLIIHCRKKSYNLCIILPFISANNKINHSLISLRDSIQSNFSDSTYILDLQPVLGNDIAQLKNMYLDEVHPKAETYQKIGLYAKPFLINWLQKNKKTVE